MKNISRTGMSATTSRVPSQSQNVKSRLSSATTSPSTRSAASGAPHRMLSMQTEQSEQSGRRSRNSTTVASTDRPHETLDTNMDGTNRDSWSSTDRDPCTSQPATSLSSRSRSAGEATRISQQMRTDIGKDSDSSRSSGLNAPKMQWEDVFSNITDLPAFSRFQNLPDSLHLARRRLGRTDESRTSKVNTHQREEDVVSRLSALPHRFQGLPDSLDLARRRPARALMDAPQRSRR